ncbi:TPM domain-containing protein [Pseudaminobacter sp. NGMCC 1.201702]|uniref:TPM domain-containing protein n=1 Tax=Pseudaminobacter sp. NGMCC 1.201702 TaxID=3391825 RepID=UPI0039F03B4A
MAETPRSMSTEEHARVVEAIRAAERQTAGEIYCVVARSSDSYFLPAAFFVTIAILLVSLCASLALDFWWLDIGTQWFVAAQLLAVACALLLLKAIPALRILLVPRGLQYRRAHDNAVKQFLARNVHITSARTGVLIFVSLAERYAEIVADSGINQHVPQDGWDDIVGDLIAHARRDRLADGFVSAVATVGQHLALHFPVGTEDINELDDHLVEI